MKILILGAGKMGSFFVDLLSFDHETAVYDVDPKRLRFMYNTQRFTTCHHRFSTDKKLGTTNLEYGSSCRRSESKSHRKPRYC